MTGRVLVTRPEPGAGETAARLQAMGLEPVVLPLTRIVTVEPMRLPDVANQDAVIVTSPNAIRHAPASLLAALARKPLFAVGEASAEAARRAGFGNVRAAAGTAVDLAGLIGGAIPKGSRLLHLAAVQRTVGFEEDLVRRGFSVEIVEVYSADEVIYSTDFLSRLLSSAPIQGAPVLSERAAMLLAQLVGQDFLHQSFENTRFFCISDKVARPLRRLGQGEILVSDEPSEDSVLALVSSQE